eukprot:CAMPEP_0114418406 /NCGR_PEP_ID=MMETSP0103-20121206/3479_1 /TAXON_ID=37642 ORGANISM="Paraphysomonas imperforata, Strain PA2" /NCGR_SAMPLE_ID=MMETSP0103 /ASSEMBLY_ACC=CAM_ASM_000201 /LENGTH=210 /DNA_ID=CAMNT_0001586761 /DNA_START=39 /DNA_END=671 /DNA_ORIENTATION=-
MINFGTIWLCFSALITGIISSDTTGGVIDVTAENIDEFFDGKGSHLLEFYAPWCNACNQFELPYAKLASRLSNENFMQYKVGRVNIDDNQALQSRFGVKYLPMVLLIDKDDTYLYEGSLTYTDVLAFAMDGYKTTSPLSMWDSPFGPVGTLKGLLIKSGLYLMALHPWVMNTFGVSEMMAYVLLVMFIGGTFLFVIFAGVVVQVQGLKND